MSYGQQKRGKLDNVCVRVPGTEFSEFALKRNRKGWMSKLYFSDLGWTDIRGERVMTQKQ